MKLLQGHCFKDMASKIWLQRYGFKEIASKTLFQASLNERYGIHLLKRPVLTGPFQIAWL